MAYLSGAASKTVAYNPDFQPMDPEIERPKNFDEHISGEDTWNDYGLRIKWTEPEVPGEFRNPLNEPLRLRVCVETKKALQVPPDDITAWCWTHMRFRENPYGIWKEIKLEYNPKCTQWDDHGVTTYVFQTFVIPTMNDNYRLTFNIKWGKLLFWANKFRVDNLLDIELRPAGGTQLCDECLPPSFSKPYPPVQERPPVITEQASFHQQPSPKPSVVKQPSVQQVPEDSDKTEQQELAGKPSLVSQDAIPYAVSDRQLAEGQTTGGGEAEGAVVGGGEADGQVAGGGESLTVKEEE